MRPTTWIQSYVAKFEIVFFTLDTSGDSELENGMSYTAVEEKWESNCGLKVDKLCNPTFEKMALECFGPPTGELFFVCTHSAFFTPS